MGSGTQRAGLSLIRLLPLVLVFAFAARSADARPGFRVGVTDDPDSLFGGFVYGIPMATVGPSRLVLEPGIDLGIPEDPLDLIIRGTLHFQFHFALGGSFGIYPLVGPAVAYYDWDRGNDTEVGVDLGVGFSIDRFNLELWAGAADVPDLTLAFSMFF